MDTGRILTRSIELLWKYKFLLLFGLVMGLTGAGISNGNSNFNLRDAAPFNTGTQLQPVVIGIAVVVGVVLFLLWLVLFFYFRFVSRGALVAAVQEIEGQGAATLQGAWKQGRTYYARLLGLGFLVNVPLALVGILVILVALVPILGLILSAVGSDNSARGIVAALGITGILSICCAVGCLIILTMVIHPLYEFAVRAIVMEDMHVRDGIRRGIARVRAHLGNVVVIYLLLMGARIGWAVVTAIVLVPIALIAALGFVGMLRSDLNALIILGLILLVPLWLLVGALEGIFQTFESNVWTETYLALMEKTEPA